MDDNTGLIFAFALDGIGGGKELNWDAIKKWNHEKGTLLVHLDYTEIKAKDWYILIAELILSCWRH